MEEIPEIKVEEYYYAKKVMHLVKEFLLKQERLNLVAGTNSSPIATRAAETLVKFGYVTFENIQTLTEVKNDRRSIKLIITLKKTSDFQNMLSKILKKMVNNMKNKMLKKTLNNMKNKMLKKTLNNMLNKVNKMVKKMLKKTLNNMLSKVKKMLSKMEKKKKILMNILRKII